MNQKQKQQLHLLLVNESANQYKTYIQGVLDAKRILTTKEKSKLETIITDLSALIVIFTLAYLLLVVAN